MQTLLALALALTVMGAPSVVRAQGRVLPSFVGIDCLVLDSNDSCGPDVRITVANDCASEVTLVDWPLTSCGAGETTCSILLAPGQVVEVGVTQPSEAAHWVIDEDGSEFQGELRIACEADGCSAAGGSPESPLWVYVCLAFVALRTKRRSWGIAKEQS